VILERYILRNYVGPFLFSISILTFLFIMDFILRYIDMFLTKGVGFLVVLQTFILSLGHMFALIIPMAVLPATLMTFGSLTSENEITAMKASGISLYRLMAPGIVVGTLLTLVMIFYNNHVLPNSNHKLLNLLIDINKKKPTAEIKENEFINAFTGYTIYLRHKNDKTGQIADVQIFKQTTPGALPTTITAESGQIKYLAAEHVLRFELENGEIHEMPDGNDPSTYRRTEFKHYVINIEDIDRSLRRSDREYRGDREMSVKQMRDRIAEIRNDIEGVNAKMAELGSSQVRDVLRYLSPAARDSAFRAEAQQRAAGPATGQMQTAAAQPRTPAPQPRLPRRPRTTPAVTYRALENQNDIKESYLRQVNRYEVEIHKKYSIPFACIIFVLIGSPIALRMGRSGMNTAIALSIFVFLVYYVCLIGGEKLADRRFVSPIVAMWSPNIVFGVGALWLIRYTTLEQSAIDWGRFNPLRFFQHRS
jgi:lipopolysaccharide export system permease protein